MSLRRFGHLSVETSRESKVLFPDKKITKGDLIDYYEKVSEYALPHLEDRPLVMQRFPDGIASDGFFHKQVPDHFPDWIERVRVKKKGGAQDLVVCGNRATLVYLADQACITLHRWLSRTGGLGDPDQLVVDLDPPGDDFAQVRRAARDCRALLDELQMPSFVMTTGSRGLHVVVPLDGSMDFDFVRSLARDLARCLARRHPGRLTVEQRKNKRKGRVYVDVARNAYAQTAVSPYSVRALPGAPVAVPVRWSEIEKGRVRTSRDYTIENVFRRLGRIEDPWKDFRRRRISAKAARSRLSDQEGE